MVLESCSFVKSMVLIVLLSSPLNRSLGMEYMVGDKDTAWSIPPNKDFYFNWSSSHSFHIGDTLVFDFETGLYNVMRVSRRDYDDCTADHPFKAFTVGPTTVPLIERGVFYFVCSVSNYCSLGQKLAIVVHKGVAASVPTSSPLPSSVPISESAVPERSQPSQVPQAAMGWSMSLTHTKSPNICSDFVLFVCSYVLCLVMFYPYL